MKKRFIFAVATALLICGCNANASKVEAPSDADSASQSAEAAAPSSVDAEDEKEFVSYDLACLQLKGHVKKMVNVERNFAITYNFSKDGSLVSVSDEQSDEFAISHGQDGELVIDSEDLVTIDNYALDNAKLEDNVYELAMTWGSEGGLSYRSVYEYDDKGALVKVTTTVEDEEGESDVFENKVTLLSFDKHGNWTSCKYVSKESESVVKRTIEYY